jgi:hypothetical protein
MVQLEGESHPGNLDFVAACAANSRAVRYFKGCRTVLRDTTAHAWIFMRASAIVRNQLAPTVGSAHCEKLSVDILMSKSLSHWRSQPYSLDKVPGNTG